MKELVISTGKLWVDKDEVLHFKTFAGAAIKENDAKEIIDATICLAEEHKIPSFLLLADCSHITMANPAARHIFTGEKFAKHVKAGAIVVNSPVSSILAKLFTAINSPPYPVKIFGSQSQAMQWLKEMQ